MNTTLKPVDRFLKDARSVVQNTGELLRAIPEDAGRKARELRRHVSTELEDARKTCVKLQKQTHKQAVAIDREIHKRPYPYLGLALVIGLVAGFLAFRR